MVRPHRSPCWDEWPNMRIAMIPMIAVTITNCVIYSMADTLESWVKWVQSNKAKYLNGEAKAIPKLYWIARYTRAER